MVRTVQSRDLAISFLRGSNTVSMLRDSFIQSLCISWPWTLFIRHYISLAEANVRPSVSLISSLLEIRHPNIVFALLLGSLATLFPQVKNTSGEGHVHNESREMSLVEITIALPNFHSHRSTD